MKNGTAEQTTPYVLFFSHLDPRVDEQAMANILAQVGTANSVRSITLGKDGNGTTALVQLDSLNEAQHTQQSLNGQLIYDKQVFVQLSSVVPSGQNNQENQPSASHQPRTQMSYASIASSGLSQHQQQPHQYHNNQQTHSHQRHGSSKFHIWVGDLDQEIDDSRLFDAFSREKYPSLLEARVMWDNSLNKSRGFAFVSFGERADAELAVQQMNGAQLGSKNIRVNWANQRNQTHHHNNNDHRQNQQQHQFGAGGVGLPTGPGTHSTMSMSSQRSNYSHSNGRSNAGPLDYNQIFNQTHGNYSTIYVGNVSHDATAEMIHPLFTPFGQVLDLKISPERCFAFVKMDSHENATQAICSVNGTVLNGQRLRCAWGRDRGSYQQRNAAMAYYGYGLPAYGAQIPAGQQLPSGYISPNSNAAMYQQQQQQGQPAPGYDQFYNQFYAAQYYAHAAAAAASGYQAMTPTEFQQQLSAQMQHYQQQQALQMQNQPADQQEYAADQGEVEDPNYQ